MPPCINKIIPSPIIAENVPFVAPLQEIHEKFTVGRCAPRSFQRPMLHCLCSIGRFFYLSQRKDKIACGMNGEDFEELGGRRGAPQRITGHLRQQPGIDLPGAVAERAQGALDRRPAAPACSGHRPVDLLDDRFQAVWIVQGQGDSQDDAAVAEIAVRDTQTAQHDGNLFFLHGYTLPW